jgi:SAM-dependent methyltransferase
MGNFNRKNHWEKIYQTKEFQEVSWYQATPAISLDFLTQFDIPLTARIIDVGGGDSFFVDCLLDQGYQDITVLDISETALAKARKRLGDRAALIKWIVADIADFHPFEKYDFWHDRATFHFLTEEQEIENYIRIVQQSISPKGILVLGTFSENGPQKCSGIEIKQYSETTMTNRLKQFFEKVKCFHVDHRTPFDTVQNFIFCSFRKLQIS